MSNTLSSYNTNPSVNLSASTRTPIGVVARLLQLPWIRSWDRRCDPVTSASVLCLRSLVASMPSCLSSLLLLSFPSHLAPLPGYYKVFLSFCPPGCFLTGSGLVLQYIGQGYGYRGQLRTHSTSIKDLYDPPLLSPALVLVAHLPAVHID